MKTIIEIVREANNNRMYIKGSTLNHYSITDVNFKWYALFRTIYEKEEYGIWYSLGTRRYK